MTDWIANAEAGSSVRAKLNSLMIPIPSVPISFPVEYITIALPSGYDQIWIFWTSLQLSTSDSLLGVVSYDGVTYVFDAVNLDSYWQFGAPVKILRLSDAQLNVLSGSMVVIPDTGPGLVVPAVAFIPSIGIDSGGPGTSSQVASGINRNAITPPPATRITNLRIFPAGNFDYPPTSGETFVSGSYLMFGLRTPT